MSPGSFVRRVGRPDLGVGEVVESRSSGHLRVDFSQAEGGAHALIVRVGELVEASTEETRAALRARN